MKIYTRRGDKGETDLFAGGRVRKDAIRVDTYGEVDELNSVVGLATSLSSQEDIRALCARIQSTLFDIGAILATPDAARRKKSDLPEIGDEELLTLESAIDTLGEPLAPLRAFVLPGGTTAAGAFHLARTVCRRAERRCVTLAEAEPIDESVVRYLNRLSDLFFTLARVENHRAGVADVEWVSRK